MSEKTEDKELCEILVEIFRIETLSYNIINKLRYNEEKTFLSQLNYSSGKIRKILKEKNYNIYGTEMLGQVYDIGQKINAVNIREFKADDRLIISQVLEPVIIKDGNVIHYGKVMLKKEEKL